MPDPMATLQDYIDGQDDLTAIECEAVDAVAARLKAWDELMAMWEDPENAEDLNGGDVVEVLGQLRARLGYAEPDELLDPEGSGYVPEPPWDAA